MGSYAGCCWLQKWCQQYLHALWQEGGSVPVLGPARLQGKMAGEQHSILILACSLPTLLVHRGWTPSQSTTSSTAQHMHLSTQQWFKIHCYSGGTAGCQVPAWEAVWSKALKANTASLVSTNNPCSSFPSFQALTQPSSTALPAALSFSEDSDLWAHTLPSPAQSQRNSAAEDGSIAFSWPKHSFQRCCNWAKNMRGDRETWSGTCCPGSRAMANAAQGSLRSHAHLSSCACRGILSFLYSTQARQSSLLGAVGE